MKANEATAEKSCVGPESKKNLIQISNTKCWGRLISRNGLTHGGGVKKNIISFPTCLPGSNTCASGRLGAGLPSLKIEIYLQGSRKRGPKGISKEALTLLVLTHRDNTHFKFEAEAVDERKATVSSSYKQDPACHQIIIGLQVGDGPRQLKEWSVLKIGFLLKVPLPSYVGLPQMSQLAWNAKSSDDAEALSPIAGRACVVLTQEPINGKKHSSNTSLCSEMLCSKQVVPKLGFQATCPRGKPQLHIKAGTRFTTYCHSVDHMQHLIEGSMAEGCPGKHCFNCALCAAALCGQAPCTYVNCYQHMLGPAAHMPVRDCSWRQGYHE